MLDIKVNELNREQLETYSRRMEAELNILNGRAAGNPTAFKKTVDERTKQYQSVQKRIHELDASPGVPDPEGTSPTLADAEGNYADNARIAHIGGIGVNNSNTDPEGVLRRQRKTLERAGIDPETVPENQLAGVGVSNVDDDDDDDDDRRQPAPKPRVPAANTSQGSQAKK